MGQETTAVRITQPRAMPSEGFIDALTAGRDGNVRSMAWR